MLRRATALKRICDRQRVQNADDFEGYQITLDRLRYANADACLNPCPPFFRSEEVSADAIDGKYFVGYEFKKSLIEVQQAVICYLLSYE